MTMLIPLFLFLLCYFINNSHVYPSYFNGLGVDGSTLLGGTLSPNEISEIDFLPALPSFHLLLLLKNVTLMYLPCFIVSNSMNGYEVSYLSR